MFPSVCHWTLTEHIACQHSACDDFAEYDGADHDAQASLQHIKDVLNATNQNPNRSLFTHVTNATNKDNIEKVFNDVQTMIINWALERAGLT